MKSLWQRFTEVKRGFEYLMETALGLGALLGFVEVWGTWKAVAFSACVVLAVMGAIGLYRQERSQEYGAEHRAQIAARESIVRMLQLFGDYASTADDNEQADLALAKAYGFICGAFGEEEAKLLTKQNFLSIGPGGPQALGDYLCGLSQRVASGEYTKPVAKVGTLLG